MIINWDELADVQKDIIIAKEKERMEKGYLTARERKILKGLIEKREKEKSNVQPV